MYVCKQTFHMSRLCMCQKVNGVIMRNLQYITFYVKTKMSVDFHICISAPLMMRVNISVNFNFRAKRNS